MYQIKKYFRLTLIITLLLPGATSFAGDSLKVKEVICAYGDELRPGKSYQEKFFFDPEGNLIKKVTLRPYNKFYNKKNHTDTLYYFKDYALWVSLCDEFMQGKPNEYCVDTFETEHTRDYSLPPFNWKLVSYARIQDSTLKNYLAKHYKKDSVRENVYINVSGPDNYLERKVVFDEKGRVRLDSIMKRGFVDCPVGDFLWSNTEYDASGNLVQYRSRNVGTFNSDEFFEYDHASGRIIRFSRNFLTYNETMWFEVHYTFY